MDKWKFVAVLSIGLVLGVVASTAVFLVGIWSPAVRALDSHAGNQLLVERMLYENEILFYGTLMDSAGTPKGAEEIKPLLEERKESHAKMVTLIDQALEAIRQRDGE